MSVPICKIETEYIRGWFEHGYDLEFSSQIFTSLRSLDLDLADVNTVLETGFVTQSGMCEDKGHWTVEGDTVDGIRLALDLLVKSDMNKVELRNVIEKERSYG